MRWRAVAAGLLTTGSVIALSWVIFFSPLLAVTRIEVAGVTYTSAAAVRNRAQLTPGTPLALVDISAIADTVGRLSPVRAVDVERRPPHTVRIVVHERTPIAVAPRHDGRFVLVDRTGSSIIAVKKRPDWLPFVKIDPRPRSKPAARSAFSVAAALPHDLTDRVRFISAAQPDTVRLRLRGGATVIWGDPARSGEKARALQALLRTDAKTYDVSSPEVVTTRN
jgi:cell division protein FtsQ